MSSCVHAGRQGCNQKSGKSTSLHIRSSQRRTRPIKSEGMTLDLIYVRIIYCTHIERKERTSFSFFMLLLAVLLVERKERKKEREGGREEQCSGDCVYCVCVCAVSQNDV